MMRIDIKKKKDNILPYQMLKCNAFYRAIAVGTAANIKYQLPRASNHVAIEIQILTIQAVGSHFHFGSGGMFVIICRRSADEFTPAKSLAIVIERRAK